MKKLSKAQAQKRAEIAGRVGEAWDALEEAVTQYNQACDDAWAAVEVALAKSNDATNEANEFRDDIYTEQDDYFTERSERWQEGEAGEAFAEWHEAWGEEFEEVELERPDALELPAMGATALEELPEEVGAG